MTRALRAVVLTAFALLPVAFAQNYEGNLDAANCSIIGGWAADANQPNTPINVDIYDGNTYLTTTLANAYRSDLGFVGYYHGFTITTPASLKNNAYHYIIAKYGGTNIQLGSSDIPLYCTATSTGYQYYYSDTFGSIIPNAWYSNGSITTSSAGLTSSSTSGGSVISKAAVQGSSSSEYEVKATLTLTGTGGSYALYTEATSNALYGPSPTGTAYAVELQNVTFNSGVCTGTLALYKQVNGAITPLTSTTWGCHNGMTLRFVYTFSSQLAVYVDNAFVLWTEDSTIGPGQPGVGVRAAPSTNGIARVDLGPHDGIAPTAVNAQLISTSSFPTRVDMQWGATVDDPNGTGIALYQMLRNGTYIGNFETSNLSDEGVSTPNTYSYTIYVYDYHLNAAATGFSVTMPPAGSIDPRQVGVRPLGSYWGGTGEQIDMRSGTSTTVCRSSRLRAGAAGASGSILAITRNPGVKIRGGPGNWAAIPDTATAGVCRPGHSRRSTTVNGISIIGYSSIPPAPNIDWTVMPTACGIPSKASMLFLIQSDASTSPTEAFGYLEIFPRVASRMPARIIRRSSRTPTATRFF